jgi:hypothetical protein
VIARIIRTAALVATALVVVSFVMFVADQSRNGSKQQIAALNADAQGAPKADAAATNIDQADPSAAVKRVRSERHSALREKVDEVDDVLLKPFAGIVHSKSIWVQRGIPTLLALLTFGLALPLAAGYVRR